jgi:hypothetical protein
MSGFIYAIRLGFIGVLVNYVLELPAWAFQRVLFLVIQFDIMYVFSLLNPCAGPPRTRYSNNGYRKGYPHDSVAPETLFELRTQVESLNLDSFSYKMKPKFYSNEISLV